MLKYRYDDRIFYIGKSVNLQIRIYSHIKKSASANNKLGLFLRTVGWKNVSVHIIEFCSISELDNRENYYIKTHLPSLNSKFSSEYSYKVYRSLTGILENRQGLIRKNNPNLNKEFKATDKFWIYTIPSAPFFLRYYN